MGGFAAIGPSNHLQWIGRLALHARVTPSLRPVHLITTRLAGFGNNPAGGRIRIYLDSPHGGQWGGSFHASHWLLLLVTNQSYQTNRLAVSGLPGQRFGFRYGHCRIDHFDRSSNDSVGRWRRVLLEPPWMIEFEKECRRRAIQSLARLLKSRRCGDSVQLISIRLALLSFRPAIHNCPNTLRMSHPTACDLHY